MNRFKLRYLTTLSVILVVVLSLLIIQAGIEKLIFNPVINRLSEVSIRQKTMSVKPLLDGHNSLNSAQSLDNFLDILIKQGSEHTRLLEIHRLAVVNGIHIRKVGYQRSWMTGDILKTEMQVELSGTYPDLRQYLRDIEINDLATAVESLSFTKPASGDEVRGQIGLILFSKQGAE